jgi:hypothetical protein
MIPSQAQTAITLLDETALIQGLEMSTGKQEPVSQANTGSAARANPLRSGRGRAVPTTGERNLGASVYRGGSLIVTTDAMRS